MRTTVTLHERVMKDLLRFSGNRTKTGAVNHALADWVRLKKIQELRSLRGKVAIADDLTDLRALEKGRD